VDEQHTEAEHVVDIQGYRIGWGTLAQLMQRLRLLVPCLIQGRQPDGQRVRRWLYMLTIRRNVRTYLFVHPKRLVHAPWQAEAEGQRFARRGLTKASAERRMRHDVEHELITGKRAPYQAYRRWRARGWDRRHLAHAE
jgi:hypothetical protein